MVQRGNIPLEEKEASSAPPYAKLSYHLVEGKPSGMPNMGLRDSTDFLFHEGTYVVPTMLPWGNPDSNPALLLLPWEVACRRCADGLRRAPVGILPSGGQEPMDHPRVAFPCRIRLNEGGESS